ncbi:MAG: MmcQ/YjbR family DNA-binding protein [Helicobacteraceae bacterium]|jgi:predicted DNA-binding protein (MmcQ/YjbR family)|nr:MmcQ/YjbR family DNA-binding protein [Helicobacteraceae bacterium]
MTYETIERIALKQRGAVKEYKPSWDSTLFWVGNRMFLLIMHDDETPMMNFKNDPFINLHLREKYPDITAAYHMNKKHWNTLYYKYSKIKTELLEQLIRESRDIVFDLLTKKQKAALAGGFNDTANL